MLSMNREDLKNKSFEILNKVREEFAFVSKGEANFKTMLYFWGLIPGLIITFLLQKSIYSINNKFFATIVYIVLAAYFFWHILCIRKTLKVQPENRVVKPSKKELFKGKTKEEIEQIKKEKRKESLQKFLLLRAWDSSPNYVLVGVFDAYIVLTQLQGLLSIYKY